MCHLVLDEISPRSHLAHIAGLDTRTCSITSQDQPLSWPPSKETSSVHLGGGLPPVPGKLVKQIEKGHFIEMVKLLPEHLSSQCEDEDQIKVTKPKHKAVTNILELLQCFGIRICSNRILQGTTQVLDLLAYQHLIIQASRVSGRFLAWIRLSLPPEGSYKFIHELVDYCSYFVEFGLLSKASFTLCSYCFSTSHSSKDHDWTRTAPLLTALSPVFCLDLSHFLARCDAHFVLTGMRAHHLDALIPPVTLSTFVTTVCAIQLWSIKFTRPSFV